MVSCSAVPRFPYWKDLVPGKVRPSGPKREKFATEAENALLLRTFNRCTLSGERRNVQSCHIVPALRGRVLRA